MPDKVSQHAILEGKRNKLKDKVETNKQTVPRGADLSFRT